jgi:hypothetical protein
LEKKERNLPSPCVAIEGDNPAAAIDNPCIRRKANVWYS